VIASNPAGNPRSDRAVQFLTSGTNLGSHRCGMRIVCVVVTLLATLHAAVLSADSDAAVAVSVRVSSRTSLRVSTNVLEFTIADGATPATASIEFTAAARLPSGSGIVLNVESAQAVEGPGGAADVDTELTFAGAGDNMTSGTFTPSAGAVAAIWQGSGQHHGRIVFTLRAPAPGVYRIPVHLVLTAP
jgi:hypothetical protein